MSCVPSGSSPNSVFRDGPELFGLSGGEHVDVECGVVPRARREARIHQQAGCSVTLEPMFSLAAGEIVSRVQVST